MFNWAFKKIVKLREKVAVDLGDNDAEKPFLDHLDDLRTMIVRMCITLLVVTLGTFFFYQELLALMRYPLTLAGIADKIILQNFKVTGGFMTVMNISLVSGIVLAFPLLLYFALQFILPGLRSNEKKVIFPALSVGAGLFLMGVVFAYYVVTPRALTFFYEFSVGIGTGATAETVVSPAPAPAPTTGTEAKEQKLANEFGILWESRNAGVKNTVEASTDGKTWTPLTTVGADGKPAEPKDILFVRITSLPADVSAATPAPATTATTPAAVAAAAAATGAAVAVATSQPFIWELTEYVKFICQFVLIFGLCFELPVVVMALVKLDVLNYKVMKGSRTWAAIIITVVAAIITPTQDALTLGLLAVPMYILYEICIWLAWYMEKKDRQLYPEYYKEQDEQAKEVEVADDWDNENYNPWNENGSDDDEESSKPVTTPASEKPAAPAAEESSASAAEPLAPDEVTTSGSTSTDEPSPAGESTPTPESSSGDANREGEDPANDKRNTD